MLGKFFECEADKDNKYYRVIHILASNEKAIHFVKLSTKSRHKKADAMETLVEFYTQPGFYSLMHNLV